METLVDALELFLRRNLTRILDGLKADKVSAQEAAKALGGLESAMEEAGLAAHFEKARELFRREYQQVQDEFEQTAGKKALLSGFTRKSLEALRDTRLDLAATYVSDYLGDVRVAVTEAVVGGRVIKPEEILDKATGRTLSSLQTELSTTRMAFQRVVHLEKAKKAGVTQFLYVGPDDDVTRPFCAARVDKVFTLDEITQMDNGQGLPVEVYGGGYNCRHHWRPVSDDLADDLRADNEQEDRGDE